MPPEVLKALAKALGLAETATEAQVKKALRALGLNQASDLAVVQAVSTASRAKDRKPGRVLAKGAWWQIRAASEDVVEVLIYGDIGESWFGDSVTAKDLVEQLQKITAATINVRINSYGGSVTDGIAIYNALRRHEAEIVVDIDSVAYSIASMIAMAGDTVRMADNARFMVHAPWGYAQGNAEEMRKYADVLDGYADAMSSAYIRKTGKDDISALLKDGTDHWYSPKEALAFGFVDEITESLAAAASFNPSRFRDPAAAAAIQPKESPMNFKALAAALGIRIAANATDAQIRAAVLKKLELVDAATDVEVQAALDKRNVEPPAPTETAEQIRARTEAEARVQARNTGIRQAFAAFRTRNGVAELEVECLVNASMTVEQASQKLLAHLGNDTEPLHPRGPRVEAGEAEGQKRVSAMVLATLQRSGISKDPDTKKDIVFDGANPYRGLTLRELARMSLRASGRNPDGMDAMDVARAALVRAAGGQTTSDFPVFLENTLHKMVLTGFLTAPAVYQRFCKVGSVTDLRAWNRIVPGMIGNLEAVNEAGEYRNKNLPDGEKEPVQAKRRGNIIEVTPETIINDDLGAITDMARALGAAGPRTVDRLVFALLALNANLGPTLTKDSLTLIHATHNNTNTGVAAVAKLAAMAEKMKLQTLPGADAEKLDIGPAVSVSLPTVAGDIQVIVDSQYDHEGTALQKPNKVRGLLTDVVGTAKMPATIFYLFADPNVAPVIEVVFLDGVQQVRVVQEENFRTGGLAWRGELNVGVGAIDYRGIQYSTGA
jgi:ATP-dependent protease ClpP protease subunit